MKHGLSTSRLLAPDDLKSDTYVAVLSVVTEHLTISALCGNDEPWRRRDVVRTRWLPVTDAGVPLRIVSVCIPFVLVETPAGGFGTLDMRRVALCALSDEYARKACKRLRGDA